MNELFKNPIYVTKPLMPDISQLVEGLQNIYSSKILTNMGPYHEKLEQELKKFLKVQDLSLFNNGTIGLITALKALDLPFGSEVITTPFTFAATPHSIVWNGLKPVFCDIEPNTMTIDAEKIEALITPNTSAILPVHVYGFPCDVYEISRISKEYNLQVIYDGAHSFTTEIDEQSICNWGDITVLSFHATKLFNTIEGGALVYTNDELKEKVQNLRNFGIKDEFTVDDIGINGKLNEVQSLFGLYNLQLVDEEQKKRARISRIYETKLSGFSEISIPKMPANCSNSFQYFPILLNNNSRDKVYDMLRDKNIYARKYFFPPCTEYKVYKELGDRTSLPVTYDIADKVLCLPFYGELGEDRAETITNIIIDVVKKY